MSLGLTPHAMPVLTLIIQETLTTWFPILWCGTNLTLGEEILEKPHTCTSCHKKYLSTLNTGLVLVSLQLPLNSQARKLKKKMESCIANHTISSLIAIGSPHPHPHACGMGMRLQHQHTQPSTN